jgi:hypothetical protein
LDSVLRERKQRAGLVLDKRGTVALGPLQLEAEEAPRVGDVVDAQAIDNTLVDVASVRSTWCVGLSTGGCLSLRQPR